MYKVYRLLSFVYTASSDPIPVVGLGDVGGIPDCLHVPTLVNDLHSVPYADVAMGWRTTFESGKCTIKDRSSACVKFIGE